MVKVSSIVAAKPTSAEAGFTLIEMAVVIVIVGFFLGSILLPLATRVELNRARATVELLEEAKTALLGFAMTQGRLPCPDTDGDGAENWRSPTGTSANGCPSGREGVLPWADLGLAEVDAWGTRFRYRVTDEFTRANGDPTASDPFACGVSGDDNTCTLELGNTGDLTVSTRNPVTKATTTTAANVPAVIVSHGRNGLGGTGGEGSARAAPPAGNADETENQDGIVDSEFVTRARVLDPTTGCSDTVAGSPLCEFDDLVVWISPHVLFERMVAAGRLP